MKKFTSLFTIIMMILFFSVPVMAETCCPDTLVDVDTNIKNSQIQGAIGDGNIGIQTKGAVKNNTFNTGDNTYTGEISVDMDVQNKTWNKTIDNSKIVNKNKTLNIDVDGNVQLGEQNGKNNTAINGDNSGIVIQSTGGGEGGYGEGDNITAIVDNSTCIVEDKREFAPGPAPVIAGFADYVGSETPGYTYSTIEEMLTFGRVFTESQLRSMAGKRGLRGAVVDITMMDGNMARQKPTIHPIAKERTITVYYKAAVPSPIRRGAFITVAMKSVKGISVEALGKSGLAVLEVGGNSLFLTAEGFDITQSQHSIAVGPGVSFSSVGGSDGEKGVTGGGGLNYSYGVFGKNYKPYLRSMALYIEDADHKYAPKGTKVEK